MNYLSVRWKSATCTSLPVWDSAVLPSDCTETEATAHLIDWYVSHLISLTGTFHISLTGMMLFVTARVSDW